MESFLTHAGYAALIVFGFLEACCIPISSEITFGFAGVLAYQGHLNLALVIIIGTLAEMAGSYASYAVGRVGERPVVERLGKYALITRKDIDRAERFFAGRGAWTVAVGRMLPVIRAFTSIVAGLVEIPAVQFGILSLIGTAIYATCSRSSATSSAAPGTASRTMSRWAATCSSSWWSLALAGLIAYRLREVRRENAARQARDPTPRPLERSIGQRLVDQLA